MKMASIQKINCIQQKKNSFMASIQIINGMDPNKLWPQSRKNNGKIILTVKNNGLCFLVFKLEKFKIKTTKTNNKKFNFQIIN